MNTLSSRRHKFRQHYFAALTTLSFFTIFMYSDRLSEGSITGKTFYCFAAAVVVFISVSVYLLIRRKPLHIFLNHLDWLLILFYLYTFIRLLFTPHMAIDNHNFLGFTLLTGLYIIWKHLFINFKNEPEAKPEIMVLGVFLLVGLGHAVYGLLQLYQLMPGNSGGLFKVTGTFHNPSPYAGFVAPFIPFGLGIYLLCDPDQQLGWKLKYPGALTALACLLVLPATTMRAAWLGALAGGLWVLNARYNYLQRIKNTLRNAWQKAACIGVVIICSLGMLFILYQLKPDSAYGRLFQWRITAKMIQDKPLFGFGYDTYQRFYNLYQAQYFAQHQGTPHERWIAGNNVTAHNEYLQLWTEIGLPGLVIFISLIYMIYFRGQDIDRKDRILVIPALGGLTVILTVALFSFPLHVLPTFLLFFFFLALLSAARQPRSSLQVYPIVYKPFAGLLIASLILLSYTQFRVYKAHQKWKIAQELTQAGIYKLAIGIYAELYPSLHKNGNYLLNYGGTLYLYGNHDKAREVLLEGTQYSSDPNVFINLGNCYRQQDDFPKALQNYRLAGNITPHQIYPPYLIAKLYHEHGYDHKARLLAEEIIRKEVKVKSSAVYRIKTEMKKMLIQMKGVRDE